jgi:phosphodiesterase/alkaline phosphatase D-like protein
MSQLVVGDTTTTSARIWVQGDASHRTCEVVLRATDGEERRDTASLRPEMDGTAVVDIRGLRPNTEYDITAVFGPLDSRRISGRLHTFAEQQPGTPFSFSFVLSSCNLSVVSVTNLLAFLLAAAGTQAAMTSLDLPRERWRRFRWLQPLHRIAKFAVGLVARFVNEATRVKQPPPPFLRSPFLKLSAVFDAQIVEVSTPTVSSLPAAGDIVLSQSASGVVACTPDRTRRGLRLVLTQTTGTFKRREETFTREGGAPETDTKRLGRITHARAGVPWYTPPSFFLHAGDQIYYDFPAPDRWPDRNEYRLSYREAWQDDTALRHLLSHWPHYMTLDDHEIVDQFARDFIPPAEGAEADDYLAEAAVAYREYVHERNPPNAAAASASPGRPSYWYSFEKGDAQFFVLDTRTQRFAQREPSGQIIDPAQMDALLSWMTTHRHRLKFVVTSVPFATRVDEKKSEEAPKWTAGGTHGARRNSENDKWSAPAFKAQRDLVIAHISRNSIRRLVFLTGDMHCCYHATMLIPDGADQGRSQLRTGTKYDSITVHELAAGPASQLQIAKVEEFLTRYRDRAIAGSMVVPYEVVLERFHGEVSAVMHVQVDYVTREPLVEPDPALQRGEAIVPEVEWSIVRTLTDVGASAWKRASRKKGTVAPAECVMAGRITFLESRSPDRLRDWEDQTAATNPDLPGTFASRA